MVTLDRGMGLAQAAATNIIGMVGVGPFLTIPFMVAAMNGPHLIYAWAFGAVLALCDGLVYAELGAALPGSGGPYVYLREAYAPFGLGRLMAFVFIFQIMLVAPLSIAGGAVGFADYLGFYWSSMTPAQHNLVAAAVCAAVTALLYRDIRAVGRLAVAMLTVVLGTLAWVIGAGLFRFSWTQAFAFPAAARRFDADLVRAIGAAGLIAMYNYGGYNNVCNIAEEIEAPDRTVPRAIVASILLVVVLYIVMSTVILGMVPWQEAQQTRTIASLFIARTFTDPAQGRVAAVVMTALILFITASSLYAVVLGYSRIPFAAARDGQFFGAFARLHPTKHFPHVSLLTIGAISIPFCFFSLGQLVTWLIQVQILLQFVWQCIAVMLLRRYRPDIAKPFRMWFYPLPAIVSLLLWLYVFATGSGAGIAFSTVFLAAAVAAFFMFERTRALEPAAPPGRPPTRGAHEPPG
jgi:amino acid transporter